MVKWSFWALAQLYPQSLAVIEPDGRGVNAGDLLAMANRLVHGLRAQGLRPGEVLAVAMSNRVELLQLYFAALQAGWYFLPLNPAMPAPELKAMLEVSQARLLVFDSSCQG